MELGRDVFNFRIPLWCIFTIAQSHNQSRLPRAVMTLAPLIYEGRFVEQKVDEKNIDAKKCVVTVARLQTSSIFMRDMYGRVNKKGWFKK